MSENRIWLTEKVSLTYTEAVELMELLWDCNVRPDDARLRQGADELCGRVIGRFMESPAKRNRQQLASALSDWQKTGKVPKGP